MKQIPMLNLLAEYEYMKSDVDEALRKCLKHQQWVLGPEVKELEERIAAYLGVKHCIGTSSGTEALVLSLRALAIRGNITEYFSRDAEIITTPFTFTATGDAILRSGATPVFVDIDPVTFNIDCSAIRNYIVSPSGHKVIGVIPVHLYGQACCMDELLQICREHGLFLVEDAAQAFGGSWHGKKLGSFGSTGAFSFFPSKNLGGFGDGGMVSTDDDQIAGLIRMLLKHGGKDKYNVDHIGYNARLDTIQAAVLLAKLRFTEEFNERRRKIAAFYDQALRDLRDLALPWTITGAGHVYHQYTVRTSKRDALQRHLKDKGIATMIYYPFPLHRMKVFSGGMSKMHGLLPHAEKVSSEVLSLPIEPLQTEEETNFIIESVKGFFAL